jgi:hypothetical protein
MWSISVNSICCGLNFFFQIIFNLFFLKKYEYLYLVSCTFNFHLHDIDHGYGLYGNRKVFKGQFQSKFRSVLTISSTDLGHRVP